MADPMTVDERTAAAARVGVRRFEGVRARDREIARLGRLAELREGRLDPRERESWESAKEALWRSGSFGELERWLSVLERRRPVLRAAVEAVYGVDSELREVGPALSELARRGVSWVGRRMPREILVPERDELARVRALRNGKSKAHADARAARNAEIRRQRGAGWTISEICRAHGLGRSRVFEILRDEEFEEAG